MYVVEEQVNESPIYNVCPETGGNKTRTLHRNLHLVHGLPVSMSEQSKNKTPTKERQKTESQRVKHGQREPVQSRDSHDSDDDIPRAQYWLRVSRPAQLKSPHTTLPYVPQRRTVTSSSSHEQARLITLAGEERLLSRITPEEHALMEQEQSSEQEFEQISDNEYERTAGNDHEQDTEHPYENGPARCDTNNERRTTPLWSRQETPKDNDM